MVTPDAVLAELSVMKQVELARDLRASAETVRVLWECMWVLAASAISRPVLEALRADLAAAGTAYTEAAGFVAAAIDKIGPAEGPGEGSCLC